MTLDIKESCVSTLPMKFCQKKEVQYKIEVGWIPTTNIHFWFLIWLDWQVCSVEESVSVKILMKFFAHFKGAHLLQENVK